ncbi:MAG: hypothetical protein IH962_06035 [Chloroflexi bacterium]|nr:hypothetical protein [Chloroflexota bacterium]
MLSAIVLPSPPDLLAQETDRDPYFVTEGAYEIEVMSNLTNISVGRAQLVIIVNEAASGQPVPDARVTIRTKNPPDGREGWATALNSPVNPARYTTELRLRGPGVWNASVEVISPLGTVIVDIPALRVPPTRWSTAGGMVFVVVFIVLGLGAGYLWWSSGRVRKRMAAARLASESAASDNGLDTE